MRGNLFIRFQFSNDSSQFYFISFHLQKIMAKKLQDYPRRGRRRKKKTLTRGFYECRLWRFKEKERKNNIKIPQKWSFLCLLIKLLLFFELIADRRTGATGENTQKARRQWRQTDANTVTWHHRPANTITSSCGRKRLGSASSSRISHPRSIVPL